MNWPTTPAGSLINVPCRHGCPMAIALFDTPEGCVVFKEDKQQYLCAQHIISDGFIESPTVICELEPGILDGLW